MSEEIKQPEAEETVETPEVEAEVEETAAEEQKPKKKKEKGITFTHEQVEQMELAVKQLEAVKDQYTRLGAEYDNYRKRTTKEKDNIYQDAKADTIKAFLAVYDNLERAAAAEGGEDSPHKKGLEMIFAQFKDILAKQGVTEIEAKGQPFDPEKHNAVMREVTDDPGKVLEVYQKGYRVKDRIIRYAMVKVSVEE